MCFKILVVIRNEILKPYKNEHYKKLTLWKTKASLMCLIQFAFMHLKIRATCTSSKMHPFNSSAKYKHNSSQMIVFKVRLSI